MATLIEQQIELENMIEARAVSVFPEADPKWFSGRHMDMLHDNARKSAKILMLMWPEVVNVRMGKKDGKQG